MGGTAKNLIVLLGLATIAFAGFFLYKQQSEALLLGTGDQTMEAMLIKTQAFIEYRKQLDQVSIDQALFEDARFRSLQGYTNPVQDLPFGKTNPFTQKVSTDTNFESIE
jgi:hypothetical protein